ncbi:MAG: sugar-binding protein, partial [Victivallaceae bacterium]
VELKGTVKRAFIGGKEWVGSNYYKDMKHLKSNVGEIKVQPDWVCYKGTFKTGPDAKRVALYVSIWGSEADRSLPDSPGEYLLIDKVEIEEKSVAASPGAVAPQVKIIEKKTAVTARTESAPELDGKLDDSVWNNAQAVTGFVDFKIGSPVKAATTVKALSDKDNLYLGIKCNEPQMDKLKAAVDGTGKNIWQDDVVEIFFAPVVDDRVLTQLVVSAGGGRWMGLGSAQVERYGEWDAKVAKSPDSWTAEVKIPFKLLGWTSAPQAGEIIGFNVCRERVPEKELSCWSPVRGNFHDKEHYGVLVLESCKINLEKSVKELKDKLGALPSSPEKSSFEKQLTEIAKKVGSEVSPTEFGKLSGMIESLKSRARFLQVKNLPFAVAVVPPTANFAIPFTPDEVFQPQDKIKLTAAVNEFKPLPLAVANMTNLPAAYRVIIYSGMDNGIEIPGLEGFSPDKITLREAVRVKDSDAPEHGLLLDPLPLMNQAYTITVLPRESGLVWVTFDCNNVKPGAYKGMVRIIPLSEPGKFANKGGWKYEGPMQDIPLELNVLPIELSKEPVMPLWLMRDAVNEKFFKSMTEHGDRTFQLSPWLFNFNFDAQGNVLDNNLPKIENIIKNHLEWSRKYGVTKGPRFLVGFSSYDVFARVHGKQFKYDSAEWRNAWQNWVKGVDSIMKRCGASQRDYVLELWDEPHLDHFEKMFNISKLAKAACPGAQTQVTFGATRHSIASLEKLLPYIDIWCMWGSYFDDHEYVKFYEKLKAQDKKIWFYYCSTNLREPLYRYYRRHAWIGYLHKVDAIGLFTFIAGPGGYYGKLSWKTDPFGGVAYRSFDECIPSIRYECLRIGNTDVKYLQKLAELAEAATARNLSPELVKQAKILLRDEVYKVAVTQAHNPNSAVEVRNKAIDLILKLQDAVK